MPANKPPENLQSLVITKVSESIVGFSITESSNSDVIELLDDESKRSWSTMSELFVKRLISVTCEQQIQDKSLQIWSKKKRTLECLTDDKEDNINQFIHYICLNRKDNWRFKLNRKSPRGILFMMKFNPNVSELAMQSVKAEQMLIIFQNLKNLTSVDFRVSHNSACLTVARFCRHLRKVRFNGRFIPAKHAEAICFMDYPNNTIKNFLCGTLEHIDAWLAVEALIIFMENMSSLKKVSKDNTVDYGALVATSKKSNRKIFPSMLDYVNVMAKFDVIDMKEIFQNFPSLKTLELTCIKNQVLSVSNTLETLIIHYDTFTNESYVVMPSLADLFQTNSEFTYENLKHLALEFLDHTVVINFTEISQRCPNIKSLFLGNCEQKKHLLFLPFPNLEKLLISTAGDVHSCVPIEFLAPTLKTLGIKKNGVTSSREDLTAGLLSYTFPNLELLEYSPSLGATEDKLFQLLDLCPKLTKLGIDKKVELSKSVNKRAALLNWDLTVYETHASLMDLF